MPTTFESLIALGNSSMKAQTPCTVICGAVTKTGMRSAIISKKTQQEQGFMDEADGFVILTQAEVTALGLAYKTEFTVDGESVEVAHIAKDAGLCDVYFKHSR